MQTALIIVTTIYVSGFLWGLIANPFRETPGHRLIWAVIWPITAIVCVVAGGDA